MRRVLTPTFRRWAYGVSAAAVGVAAGVGWIEPETAVVIGPLLMALFYVDDNGSPQEQAPPDEEVTGL